MASALVKLNVVDFDLNPLYTLLIHSSNINRVDEQGTFRSVTYYDLLQDQFFILNVSDSLNSIISQSGLIRINATAINGQLLESPVVMGIQEFNVSRIDDVNTDGNDYRQITYVNKGGQIDIITVSDSLDTIQAQTIAAGGVVPSLAIIAPPAGTYVGNDVTVTLSSNAIGATIYYTIDGSTPTTSSTLYTAPFIININRTIKAIAVLVGVPTGGVTEAAINVKCFTPVASPIGGVIGSANPVTLTTATTSGTIRYTTNGVDPTSSDTIYTTPIFLTADTTLKSRTFKANQVESDVRTNTYTVAIDLMFLGDVTDSGAVDNRLYRSFNFGVTWGEPRPNGNVDTGWSSVTFPTGGGFVLAGSGLTNRIWYSTNNGGSWSERFSPNANTFSGTFVYSRNSQKVLANGLTVNSAIPRIFISTDNGDNWSALIVDGFTAAGYFAIGINGNTVVASRVVTFIPEVAENRISKDGGTTWITPTGATIGTSRRFDSDIYISGDEQTLIGTTRSVGGNVPQLAISNNGGSSFTTLTSPLASAAFIIKGANNKSRIFAARTTPSASTNNFWYSDNVGATWTLVNPRPSLNSNEWRVMECSEDGTKVVIADNNRAYYSSNGGVSFSEIQPAGNVNRNWGCAMVKSL